MNEKPSKEKQRCVIGQLTVTALVTKRRTVVVAFPGDADEGEVEEVLTELLEGDDRGWEILEECHEEPVLSEEGAYIHISPAGRNAPAECAAVRDADGMLVIRPVS
jgi:flavoprotein